jgi:hypothetical protein
MTAVIAPIVEGQTEQMGGLERLLQRVWVELLGHSERLQIVAPYRGNRDALVHPKGEVLAEATIKAFLKLKAKTQNVVGVRSLVLILLDAERDCPATLAPRLLETARNVLPSETPVACVLARRMFENWIVGGASTLAGVNELPNPLPTRENFEELVGAKWLDDQLRGQNRTRKYKKLEDAEPFIRKMDLGECRQNCPSFDKLCRELETRLPPLTRPDDAAAADTDAAADA